jgi:uncharacterized protein with PIN domain
MNRAALRAYADLNDHLAPDLRQTTFAHDFHGRPSVKDLIESVGIPHPEVDWILINGRPARFGQGVVDGDRISVYPRFRGLDLPDGAGLLPRIPRPTRFILDVHLGQLARYLRMLGFDCLYSVKATDPGLAAASNQGGRILLTRDRELLKRNDVSLGAFVRATEPRRQLRETVRRWQLAGDAAPLTRCIACNGRLERATMEQVGNRVPANVRSRGGPLLRCHACGRVYWHGSHVDNMQELVDWALTEERHPGAGR